MIRKSSCDENKEMKYESNKVDLINFYREKAFSVKNFFSKKLEGEILEMQKVKSFMSLYITFLEKEKTKWNEYLSNGIIG